MATGILANPSLDENANHPAVDLSRDTEFLLSLAEKDRWFYTHFVWAPRVVAEHLSRVVPLESSTVLDFGCGEGLMAKGLGQLAMSVHGVDLSPFYHKVDERIDRMFGPGHTVQPVHLRSVDPAAPLPYADGAFDAAFAWSVFEHVADTPRALREIHRVLRPGGAFFLIINPMYLSAHGNHLWNVVDEPWAHLMLTDEELRERVRTAVMKTEVEPGRTDVYQGNKAEEYRDSLFECLDSLNKLTLGELRDHLRDVGFTIVHEECRRSLPYEPPEELSRRYDRDDLMIDEIRLVARR